MTTTCSACGATGQSGAFCTVCGTPTVAAAYREPSSLRPRLEVTTEPEVRESTRRGAAGMLRAGAAAAPAPRLAGTGRRAAAFVLDMLALGLVALVAGVVVALLTGVPGRYAALGEATTELGAQAAVSDLVASLGLVYGLVGLISLLGWVGLAVADGITGRTLGNRMLGIRTVVVDGDAPVRLGRGLLRWLILALSGVVPVVGTVLVLVSPAFDPTRRQGWHDKASRAMVLDVRGAVPRSFAPAAPAAPAAPERAPAGAAAPPPTPALTPGAPSAMPAPTPGAPSATPAGDLWSAPPGSWEQDGVVTGVPGVGAPPRPSPAAGAPTEARSPAPAVPPAPAPASVPAPDQDEGPARAPEVLDDLEETRFSVSSRRATGDGAASPRIVVELDSERRVHVATRTLVGRNPLQDGGPTATLLRVEDVTRSLSKNHLELLPSADGLQVTDLGSTNGSAAIAPDGTVRELTPGTPITVTPGWIVQAGERRLTVVGPDGGT